MGYHNKVISKGILGQFSKIKEEFEELEDANDQDCKILILCELSDLIGSIEEYLKNFNLTINDLKLFSDKTKTTFKEGTRK